jgi:TPR repeat protein
MKRSVVLLLLLLIPVFAATPPGVTKRLAPGHANIVLYEQPTKIIPSFWGSFFRLLGIPLGTKAEFPFQRSIAVLVGIGHYEFMPRKLEYVAKDAEKMRDYLLEDGGFDAVYVMDENVSPDVVEKFMADELPHILNPDDRLLFYYSGHGDDPGTGHPVLQFQKAKPNEWGHDVLRVDEYEQWSGILKNKHVLFIYDACTAGEATMISKSGAEEVRAAISELSGNGSRIVVTAGTAKQQAWVLEESSSNQYSIFTDALLRALRNGTVDSKIRGFITIGQAVEEAKVLIANTTSKLKPHREMTPDHVPIGDKYTGTFVFLDPHADHPSLHPSDIRSMGITAVPKGTENADFEKEMELAVWADIDPLNDAQLYAQFCDRFPNGLLCTIARKRMEKLSASQITNVSPEDLTRLSVDELKSLAANGSKVALTQLGKVYESGLQGAPVDLPTSVEFYKQSSALGDGEASFRIGKIYQDGRQGMPRDEAQAEYWYRKGAYAGDGQAMTNLGLIYETGYGEVRQDYSEALDWFRKAAVSNGRGMAELGHMYEKGLGIKKDYGQAKTWYRKAAEIGDAKGMLYLGTMYENGRGALKKDKAEAMNWFRRAADTGDGVGMDALGNIYARGWGGVKRDYVQALTWYRKAVDVGNGHAMANLGEMYENGLGLKKDIAQAENLYRKAAAAGDASGMFHLGQMYEDGKGGLKQDVKQAVAWYSQGARLGDRDARNALVRLGSNPAARDALKELEKISESSPLGI